MSSSLFVRRGVATSHKTAADVQVPICNISEHSDTVGALIVHVYRADTVTHSTPTRRCPPTLNANLLHFGDSPLAGLWKEQLRAKLIQRAEVFSTCEWEVGCAQRVEHCIRLRDNTHLSGRDLDVLPLPMLKMSRSISRT